MQSYCYPSQDSSVENIFNRWNWTTATSAPNNVVLRLELDKGLLNEGDDLLLDKVRGRHIVNEFKTSESKKYIAFEYNMDV